MEQTLRALGDEDMGYLTPEGHEYYMWKCLEKGAPGAVDYMVTKHFDTRAPWNHNVIIHGTDIDYNVSVHVGDGQWKSVHILDILRADLRDLERLVASEIGSPFAGFEKEDVNEWIRTVVAPLGHFWPFCTWIDPADPEYNPKALRKCDTAPLVLFDLRENLTVDAHNAVVRRQAQRIV